MRDDERITNSVVEYKDLNMDDVHDFMKCKAN